MKPADEIDVLYTDLERIHKTLSGVYNFLWAHDLIQSYQRLRPKAQESALTTAVKLSRDKVFGYIHEAQQEGEEEDE